MHDINLKDEGGYTCTQGMS